MTSPGRTSAPAQTILTLTDPGLALTVPCAETAFDQTGKSIAVRSATSRTPASITSPTILCARHEVASNSPNIPSVDSEVVATTSASPGRQTSIAAWIIRLSPGGVETVTAEAAIRADG